MIRTEAWVLYASPSKASDRASGELVRETFSFPDLEENEILAEPLYGCWEGNMSHAISRQPVDICRQRGEDKIVIGNAGVVRILQTGSAVKTVKEGECHVLGAIGTTDRFQYLQRVFAYDEPYTVGLLAKRMKLTERQLGPIPPHSRFSLRQWAAFSLRYPTAWASWKLAYACWRLQVPEQLMPNAIVWGWGGGVTLAELTLAKLFGAQGAMIASTDVRLALIESAGLVPIDRREFSDLNFDEKRYETDEAYRVRYRTAEKNFLRIVRQKTEKAGVSIFIDNIGEPVFRATLKALAREGVITTVGWKKGMALKLYRAPECIAHHIHVFSHGAKYDEGLEAIEFAEREGWIPQHESNVYGWDEIPKLAEDFRQERISTYFPLYQINPE